MKLETQRTHFIKLKQLSKARYNYNGAIFTLNGKNHLIYRCQNSLKKHSWLGYSLLDDKYQAVNYKRLDIPKVLCCEDPRVVVHNGKIHVFYCSGETNDMEGWRSKDFLINVGIFDADGNFLEHHELLYDGTVNVEKNWQMFYDRERFKWHCLYTINPWVILEFDEKWKATKVFEQDFNIPWDYGTMRGGTSPLTCLPDLLHRVSGREELSVKYYTFFHSRRDYPVKRLQIPPKYYGGCLSFSTDYPYKPIGVSKTPLLQPEEISAVQAKVIFPSGVIMDCERFVVSSGSGDSTMRIDIFDRDDVEAHMLRFQRNNEGAVKNLPAEEIYLGNLEDF